MVFYQRDVAYESSAESGVALELLEYNHNPAHFLEYLGTFRGSMYHDAKAADRAGAELDSIKQKPKERFEDYRVRYENLLAKSESLDLPDREKIIMIQRGLRRDFDLQMCSGRDPKEGLRGCCGEMAGSRGRTGGLRASGDETAYTFVLGILP
ncbi:hypothetical protein E4U44_006760 [Claviceps purpurea]|nr:hypothetical protein E4U44_006760 [Claviceps purpurea]